MSRVKTKDFWLPAGAYFQPNLRFVNFMKDLAGPETKTIIDCGSGSGLTVRTLKTAGLSCAGIDVCYTEGADPKPYLIDATEFKFLDTMIALIARPSLGKWVHLTVKNALASGARVVYVGKDINFTQDVSSRLDPDEYYWICRGQGYGLDNEILYEVFNVTEKENK
jgi:hypothetical protein